MLLSGYATYAITVEVLFTALVSGGYKIFIVVFAFHTRPGSGAFNAQPKGRGGGGWNIPPTVKFSKKKNVILRRHLNACG